MITCTICRFEVVEDDVVIHFGQAQCICLACYLRETGNSQRMPKWLRREIVATLAAVEGGAGSDVAA